MAGVVKYLADPDVTLYHGDAEAVLRELPAESVHMAATSPPFFGLRDYGVEGQIGLEATPDEWATRLVAVFEQVRRVLRPDGTLWVECGDSYVSGQGGRQSAVGELPPTTRFDRKEAGTKREGLPSSFGERDVGPRFYPGRDTGLKPKDLIGAPWLLAFALRDAGWYLRSCIIWAKPNPMPESVTDRPTTAHSYVFLFSKRARYFFDAEALREPSTGDQNPRNGNGPRGRTDERRGFDNRVTSPTRSPRSVWTIATQPYPEAHFATFPEELVRRCILAGTSERGVCPECGAPWVREAEREVQLQGAGRAHIAGGDTTIGKGWEGTPRASLRVTTLGWNHSCDHGAEPVPATVLDPFVGSGTSCLVARKHGRRSIGIDLSADYLAMAARRLSQLSLLAEAT